MPKKKPTKVYRYDGQSIWTSSDSGYLSYSDYELGSYLGGGAAGEVYEAECFKTKRVSLTYECHIHMPGISYIGLSDAGMISYEYLVYGSKSGLCQLDDMSCDFYVMLPHVRYFFPLLLVLLLKQRQPSCSIQRQQQRQYRWVRPYAIYSINI